MGIGIAKLSCGAKYCSGSDTTPNPNKYVFEIEWAEQVGHNCVTIIRYPNCISSEQRKVCVFANTKVADLLDRTEIDPHFVNNSLIARVRYFPDKPHLSMQLAINIAQHIKEYKE